MNRNSKKVLFAIIVIAMVAGTVLANYLIIKNKIDSDDPSNISTEVEGEGESNNGLVLETITAPEGEESMEGKTSFGEIPNTMLDAKALVDLNLEPKLNADGTQKTIVGDYKVYTSTSNGKDYVISGVKPVEIVGEILPEGSPIWREEKSCQLIKFFSTQIEQDEYAKRVQYANKIINSEEIAPKGTIILNGAVISATFVKSNGQYYVNLNDLFAELNNGAYFDELKGTYMVNVSDNTTIYLPTDALWDKFVTTFNVFGGCFDFKSWNSNYPFTQKVPLINSNGNITVSRAVQMFGWQAKGNDDVLVIMTNEVDVPCKYVVYDFGGQDISGVSELGDDGIMYYNRYDSAGNLISSEPLADVWVEPETTEVE